VSERCDAMAQLAAQRRGAGPFAATAIPATMPATTNLPGRNAMMTRLCLAILALAIPSLAMLAAPAALHAQDRIKVAIGQINNWENQPPTLGQDAGIFKKHGLVLETFGTAGAGETLQPIISGSADIGIGVGVAGVMRAFGTGAPVRILAPSFTGTHDLFWYVPAASPIHTIGDITARNTVAYSTNGSSSHNLVLAFIDELGLKGKPTPTGSPPSTLTSVMSGQVDVGWSAPPLVLQEVKDGKARIVIRGSDAPSLRNQTVRATIANADFLAKHPDVAARFMAAYRETVDWMYSDPKAIELYAQKVEKPVELIRDTIKEFYPKDVLQTDRMSDMPGILRDAVKLKYLRAPLSDAQIAELVHIPPR
jgi:NitT/TauT family transport system substrate-binding protein